ncbi:MAG: T9SS type A sorting domain-containing protein [Cyclobacteriaceae bacterium]
MTRFIVISIFIIYSTLVFGQTNDGANQKEGSTASISGTVLSEIANEPVEGMVIVYKIVEGPYIPIDTVGIDENGVFVFEGLPHHQYIIRARSKKSRSGGLYPTYFPKAEFYSDAQIIDLIEDVDSANISMITLPPFIEAYSYFAGSVKSEVELPNGVQSIGCTMYRKVRSSRENPIEYVLYDYDETDMNGIFEYQDFEGGEYYLHVEYPGIPSDSNAFFEYNDYEFTTEITATITNSKINIVIEKVPILNVQQLYFSEIKGYPNPVINEYTLDYQLSRSTDDLQYFIYSTAGTQIASGRLASRVGAHQHSINLENISQGLYILTLTNADQSISRSLRIVKK